MFLNNNIVSNKNIFKILFLSILLLCIFHSHSFAATQKEEDPKQSQREEIKYFFDENDPYQELSKKSNDEGDGKCHIRCRLLNPNVVDGGNSTKSPKEKYVTRIVDFDAATGVTSCEVYPLNYRSSSEKLSLMANRKDIV